MSAEPWTSCWTSCKTAVDRDACCRRYMLPSLIQSWHWLFSTLKYLRRTHQFIVISIYQPQWAVVDLIWSVPAGPVLLSSLCERVGLQQGADPCCQGRGGPECTAHPDWGEPAGQQASLPVRAVELSGIYVLLTGRRYHFYDCQNILKVKAWCSDLCWGSSDQWMRSVSHASIDLSLISQNYGNEGWLSAGRFLGAPQLYFKFIFTALYSYLIKIITIG